MVPGGREPELNVSVRAIRGEGAEDPEILTSAGESGLGIGMASDRDRDRDPSSDGVETLGRNRERHRVLTPDLKVVVPPGKGRVGPAQEQAAVLLGPTQCGVKR